MTFKRRKGEKVTKKLSGIIGRRKHLSTELTKWELQKKLLSKRIVFAVSNAVCIDVPGVASVDNFFEVY